MDYLLGSGQIIIGVGLLVAMWFVLTMIGRRNEGRKMGRIGFAITPSLFLIWATAEVILIIRGISGM
jgi:hypothetical protein